MQSERQAPRFLLKSVYPMKKGAGNLAGTKTGQESAVEANDEIASLKGIVLALRKELERQVAENRNSVQRATAHAAGEIAQLKATIIALRQELDRQKCQHALELQELRVSSNQEQRQLHNTIVQLRTGLEELNERR